MKYNPGYTWNQGRFPNGLLGWRRSWNAASGTRLILQGTRDAFIADYVARWKEIEDNYRLDFMWIDDVPIFYWAEESRNHPQTEKFKDAFKHMIADYFNAAQEWGKEIYLNNKGKHLNWQEGPGCLERDNLKLAKIGPKWENPATVGISYGYMKAEEEHDAYKSSTERI